MVVDELLRALSFSIRLCLFSSIGLMPLFLFVGGIMVKTELYGVTGLGGAQAMLGNADFKSLDKVVIPDDSPLENALAIGMDVPYAMFIIIAYFPILLTFYMGPSYFSRNVAASIIGVSAFIVVFGAGYLNVHLVLDTLPMYPILFTYGYLKWKLGKKSKLAFYVLTYLFVLLLGVFLLQLFRLLPDNDDTSVLVRFIVIYPMIREVMRVLSMKTAWNLSSEVNLGPDDFQPKREYGWGFAVYISHFFAMFYRLQVMRLSNPIFSTIIIVFQAVLEVLARVTMIQRDDIMRRFYKRNWCCNPVADGTRRKSTVHVIDLATVLESKKNMSQTTATIMAKQNAKSMFYSIMVVNEMLAEYTAICLGPFLLWLGESFMLAMPYSWYATFENPFQDGIDVSDLFLFALFQLGVELVVDTFCVYFETHKSNLQLYKFWEIKPKHFVIVYILSAWFGLVCADAFFSVADNFDSCIGKDMCLCMDHGLRKGGLREKYCLLQNSTYIH